MRPYSLALVLLLVAAPAAAQDRAATERRLESLRNQIQGVEEQVQQAVRIAAVVHAVAAVLDGENALSGTALDQAAE